MHGTMDITDGGAAAFDGSPTRGSNENQRPQNTGHTPHSILTSGLHNGNKPVPQDDLNRVPTLELDGVRSNTDPVELFDALLASLESDDEKEPFTEDQTPTAGTARLVPSVLLQTSPNEGLTMAEVLSRRKRYGWNRMQEEHRSHLKTFLMFFVGPIQCVMLVSHVHNLQAYFSLRFISLETSRSQAKTHSVVGVRTGCGVARLDRFRGHCRLAPTQCDCWLRPRLSSWEYCQRTQEDIGTEMCDCA